MAEKNTQSILETIKKKLNNFESKETSNSKISNVSSEFEYVPNASKSAFLIQENEKLNSAPANRVIDDFSEFNLDDFKEKTPQKTEFEDVEKIEVKQDEAATQLDEEDLEDYEDEEEFEEESEEESEEEFEEESEAQEEIEEEDPLTFEDETNSDQELKLEEVYPPLPEVEEIGEEKIVELVQPINSKDHDDLDFSEISNLEEDSIEKSSQISQQVPQEKNSYDMELEELDKELAKQDENVQHYVEESQKESSHEDIDLEFEQELPKVVSQQPVEEIKELQKEVSPSPFEDHEDHLDFEELAMNSVPQMNQQNQISAFEMPKNNGSRILNDATIMQTSDSIRKLMDAKNIVSGISTFSQNPVLSELATHLLEPKLEKWLNEHLGELVEKIVREEIKKIIPKE